MGLLRQRDDVPGGRLFQMQEKLVSIGDDSWIEDDQGDRAYEVDGKALRRRDSCVLKDRDDNEVATIQEKKLRARDTMKVERDSRTRAKVHKALMGIRDRFDIDIERGETISAGAATSLTMTTRCKRDGDVIATVSKSSSLSLDTPQKAST